MRKNVKVLSLILAGAMAMSLAGCSGSGSKDSAKETAAKSEVKEVGAESSEQETSKAAGAGEADASGETYQIGVLQLVQHDALDAANKGFFAALDEAGINYEADQQNASGEQANCMTIAEKLVNDGSDLILAIATPAAQAVAGVTEEIPVLLTAVTDPAESGLVNDNEKPGVNVSGTSDLTPVAAQAVAGVTEEIPVLLTAVTDPAESGLVNDNEKPGVNVSGTSDLTPVKEQIDLLKELLPDAEKVGLLYCSAESNSQLQIAMAEEACKEAGLSCEEYTVPSSNEIQSVVESMVGKVDVIYAPTDNVIAAGMSTVAMIATDNQIPVICGEAGMVNAGGLATYGIDYYQLGYMTGEQAIEILTKGADVAEMPIGYLPAERMVNAGGLATYGIDYYQLGYMTGEQAIEILTKGADVAEMPIGYLPAERCALTVNKTTADTLGIDISGLEGAEIVE